MTTLSELWDQNAPPPWWRRAFDAARDADVARIIAWVAVLYCVVELVEIAAVLRP